MQAKRADGSTTTGIDVTDQATVAVAWYTADDAKAPASDWTLLPDMSGATATVSASAAGKYLKAVATSGSSTVELVSSNKVIKAGSLKAAVQKLNDKNVQLIADYSSKGSNVNDLLKAQLEKLGFDGIDVKVSEGGVLFRSENARHRRYLRRPGRHQRRRYVLLHESRRVHGIQPRPASRADVAFELSRG